MTEAHNGTAASQYNESDSTQCNYNMTDRGAQNLRGHHVVPRFSFEVIPPIGSV